MNQVIKVEPLQDFRLAVWFADGKQGYFHTKPYLEKGVFTCLKDPVLFKQAYVA